MEHIIVSQGNWLVMDPARGHAFMGNFQDRAGMRARLRKKRGSYFQNGLHSYLLLEPKPHRWAIPQAAIQEIESQEKSGQGSLFAGRGEGVQIASGSSGSIFMLIHFGRRRLAIGNWGDSKCPLAPIVPNQGAWIQQSGSGPVIFAQQGQQAPQSFPIPQSIADRIAGWVREEPDVLS